MPADKTTATSSKPSTAARRRTTRARIAKIAQAADQEQTAKASQHSAGLLGTVVESVKEVPGRVGQAVEKVAEVAGSTVVESVKEVPGRVSQAAEKVVEVAGAAAEKTGALVGDLADKVGLGNSKKIDDDAQDKRK